MLFFSPSLDELRAAIDSELERFLQKRARALEDNRPLIDELTRTIDAGGKRLRPLFCYWGFRAAGGGHGTKIVRASASLELLHTFALVHDDIMDASRERRGQPTVHAVHGTSVAVLAGDLALVLADSCLYSSGFSPQELAGALDAYLLMREEVIAGQYLDVQAAGDELLDEREARRIALLKSGRYSIEKPLVMGARLAGAADELVTSLSAFGEPLGEAFQFRDDLLGTFGNEAQLGKPTDSDIREGKRNLLYAHTVSSLPPSRRKRFVAQWGGGDALSAADVDELRSLVTESGARSHTEALVEELAARAGDVLRDMVLDSQARAALCELTELSVNRSA